MDVEAAMVDYLARTLGDAAVSAVVPEPRPGRLVTVERTGGGAANQLDHPTVAVQAWGRTYLEASGLMREVDAAMRAAPYAITGVYGVESTTVQRWGDPDSGSPRYQGLYTLTVDL